MNHEKTNLTITFIICISLIVIGAMIVGCGDNWEPAIKIGVVISPDSKGDCPQNGHGGTAVYRVDYCGYQDQEGYHIAKCIRQEGGNYGKCTFSENPPVKCLPCCPGVDNCEETIVP